MFLLFYSPTFYVFTSQKGGIYAKYLKQHQDCPQTHEKQVFRTLIKILTATKVLGYTTAHLANVPVLSVYHDNRKSLSKSYQRWQGEDEDKTRNIKLTFSTEFVFFACSTSFLQTIITDKPIEKKNCQTFSIQPLLTRLSPMFEQQFKCQSTIFFSGFEQLVSLHY